MSRSTFEDLLDYRRRVAELYAQVRRSNLSDAERWWQFREGRDELFRTHPQSALPEEQKAAFAGLRYYPYNPALRFVLAVDTDVEPAIVEMALQDDGLARMRRFGKIQFVVDDRAVSLSLFWMMGYGGGVFLPFRDLSGRDETYGGGRYLLDTIKHADLGQDGDRLIVDFNYAYNPSCAYNPRWHCPLAPQENWLPVAIRAGEMRYPGI